MQLLDDLAHEHVRIDTVVGALRTWAERLSRDETLLGDRQSFLTFFDVYAGAFHHEREEEALFQALERDALLPIHRGPIAVLLDDHRRMASLLRSMERSSDPTEILTLATAYSHALWLHIDVENSVLFPESEHQLRRNGIHELEARAATAAECEAAAIGDALIVRYPPMQFDIVRGDGCVMCHAYGATCRGLEHEWWNEWNWDEAAMLVAGQ